MSSSVKYLVMAGLALVIGTPLVAIIMVMVQAPANGEILAKILVGCFASLPLVAIGIILLIVAAVKNRHRSPQPRR